MARGGYRPGAGRPRLRPSEKAVEAASKCERTPLEYMLAVMNDADVDITRRDRMAIAAAPYCHGRVADKRLGKKDLAEAAAEKAARNSRSEWGTDIAFDRPN